MKKIVAALSVLTLLSSCTPLGQQDKRAGAIMMTTLVGGIIGYWAGGQIGGHLGSGAVVTLSRVVGVGVGAYGGWALGHMMTPDDLAAADRTAATALSDAGNGETYVWKNPASGNQGTVTPVNTYVASGGYRCRDFDVMVSTAEGAQMGQGAACQIADGSWRTVATQRG